MGDSGNDTNVFDACSTRHAATSTAKRKGISIDCIKKTAGWSENSRTFENFYDKPILPRKEAFSNAILNK